MKLHTVFITHNRLELTKAAIESYLETVTVPFTAMVVDNASTDGTVEWLQESKIMSLFAMRENRYPGSACNLGWGYSSVTDATHLQRADNDFAFLPGWCNEVERIFARHKFLGQLGLRTDVEEGFNKNNVGGNCIISRDLWDQGLRWDERPWPQIRDEVGAGWTEDSLFSKAVRKTRASIDQKIFYKWLRVERPCIRNLASGDWSDPYYQESYGIRGIRPRRADPTIPYDWKGGYSD